MCIVIIKKSLWNVSKLLIFSTRVYPLMYLGIQHIPVFEIETLFSGLVRNLIHFSRLYSIERILLLPSNIQFVIVNLQDFYKPLTIHNIHTKMVEGSFVSKYQSWLYNRFLVILYQSHRQEAVGLLMMV